MIPCTQDPRRVLLAAALDDAAAYKKTMVVFEEWGKYYVIPREEWEGMKYATFRDPYFIIEVGYA